jgi:hypothetical protein
VRFRLSDLELGLAAEPGIRGSSRPPPPPQPLALLAAALLGGSLRSVPCGTFRDTSPLVGALAPASRRGFFFALGTSQGGPQYQNL